MKAISHNQMTTGLANVRERLSFALVYIGLLGIPWFATQGAEEDADAEQETFLVQFVTATSPVDDTVFARISNAAVTLQKRSVQEKRAAYLVLQIEPGTSQFHHVQGLAKFLTSSQISNVTTVAWVPQTVTGSNVLVALACRQIVMHPDAEFGYLGRGKPLHAHDRQGVLAIAQKRHNPKVSPALVCGMMDQEEQLWKGACPCSGAR